MMRTGSGRCGAVSSKADDWLTLVNPCEWPNRSGICCLATGLSWSISSLPISLSLVWPSMEKQSDDFVASDYRFMIDLSWIWCVLRQSYFSLSSCYFVSTELTLAKVGLLLFDLVLNWWSLDFLKSIAWVWVLACKSGIVIWIETHYGVFYLTTTGWVTAVSRGSWSIIGRADSFRLRGSSMILSFFDTLSRLR